MFWERGILDIYVYIYIYTYIYIHIYIYTYTCMYVCVYACMHACVYVRVYPYTHIQTNYCRSTLSYVIMPPGRPGPRQGGVSKLKPYPP
jgi:hypothetical protein